MRSELVENEPFGEIDSDRLIGSVTILQLPDNLCIEVMGAFH